MGVWTGTFGQNCPKSNQVAEIRNPGRLEFPALADSWLKFGTFTELIAHQGSGQGKTGVNAKTG